MLRWFVCRPDLCPDDVIAQFTQINRCASLANQPAPRVRTVHRASRGVAADRVRSQPGRNFQNFGSALLLLFRMATGENWNLVMHDGMKMQSPGIAVAYA
jgi:hypothetical protein